MDQGITVNKLDRRRDPNEWVNRAGDPNLTSVKSDLARWIPAREAPDSPFAADHHFDPATVTWNPK